MLIDPISLIYMYWGSCFINAAKSCEATPLSTNTMDNAVHEWKENTLDKRFHRLRLLK